MDGFFETDIGGDDYAKDTEVQKDDGNDEEDLWKKEGRTDCLCDCKKERNESMIPLTPIPEVRDNEKKGYAMYNDGSVEVEVGEFLQSMVRLVKPKRVLESGSYKGVSSAYMADGLEKNGYGHLDTMEYERKHIETSKELWNKMGLSQWITVHHVSSLDFQPTGVYELMFLDTEPNIRFFELVRFYPHLSEGGFVFIHDLPRDFCQGNINPDHPNISSWPFGDVPDKMKQWMKEGLLVPWHFPNPRGLVGFYKPMKGDYVPND